MTRRIKKYDLEDLEEIQEAYEDVLLEKENVLGVGICCLEEDGHKTDKLAFRVYVKKKKTMAQHAEEDGLRETIDGVPVIIEEMDEPQAYRTDKYRPSNPGVSVGHFDVTAGTLGSIVEYSDRKGDLILSNNHVIANCNNCEIGDDILQPGKVDGGNRSEDVIAHLDSYVPINYIDGTSSGASATSDFDAETIIYKQKVDEFYRDFKARNIDDEIQSLSNEVDAAVGKVIDSSDITEEILEIGYVDGISQAEVDMDVTKSGRTTGLTTGTIRDLNVTMEVGYGFFTKARFKHQIVSNDMSAGGDSGSLLLDTENNAVGLLFAGTSDKTIFNPINKVLDSLDIRFKKKQSGKD